MRNKCFDFFSSFPNVIKQKTMRWFHFICFFKIKQVISTSTKLHQKYVFSGEYCFNFILAMIEIYHQPHICLFCEKGKKHKRKLLYYGICGSQIIHSHQLVNVIKITKQRCSANGTCMNIIIQNTTHTVEHVLYTV